MTAKKKRKTHSNVPRCQRMNRAARLQSARQWIAGYTGNNLVRGYAKHFAVDLLCALTELQLLGIAIDPKYVHNVKARFAHRQRKKSQKKSVTPEPLFESDFYHAMIMGYTSGGASYGITWEEWNQLQEDSKTSQPRAEHFDFDADDIPFYSDAG